MTTVSELCDFLDDFAPSNLAESWDNTGLLVGRQSNIVSRAITCLTLTPDVAEEAIKTKCQMIICHHPILFRATKRISDKDAEGRMLLSLIEAEIAVYSPHTAFDSAANGINHQIAAALKLLDVHPIKPDQSVPTTGAGRHGKLPDALPVAEFLSLISNSLNADRLEFCCPLNNPVKHIAIACGAAESFMQDAIRLGCDTFVTGEARFHSALAARTEGINLVLTGHYHSERPAVENLALTIADAFPGVIMRPSQVETNPLNLWTRQP